MSAYYLCLTALQTYSTSQRPAESDVALKAFGFGSIPVSENVIDSGCESLKDRLSSHASYEVDGIRGAWIQLNICVDGPARS